MPTSAKNKSEVQVSDTKHTRSVIRSLSPSGSVRTDLLGSWCLFHPCVFVLLTMWPAATAPMCRSERPGLQARRPGRWCQFSRPLPKKPTTRECFRTKMSSTNITSRTLRHVLHVRLYFINAVPFLNWSWQTVRQHNSTRVISVAASRSSD